MKSLNQKKKELFELLVQYYELKPEESWCTRNYNDYHGKCCAIGHLKQEFGDYGVVERTVRSLCGISLILVNDRDTTRYQQPTPKQRVIAYLNDEIKNL